MDRKLIKNGLVVSIDEKIGNITECDILIEKGRILDVRPGIVAADAELIDASDMIITPGFVDTHRHVWQTQLRTVATDWSLYDYLCEMRSVYSSFYAPEDAYLGNYAGALEAIDCGITTLVDHCHLINSPEHADELIRGLDESGIRAVFCYGLFVNPTQHPFHMERDPGWRYEDARRIRRDRLNSDAGRIVMGINPQEAEATSFESCAKEIAFARDLALHRISYHVAMGAYDPGNRFVEQLGAAGLLGEDLLFVHGASLTDHELSLLRDSGAGISCTPETELQMGMGFPVGIKAHRAGVKSSLGIDIVSNYSGDMFAQMRMLLQTQRALDNEVLISRHQAPRKIMLSAKEVLRLATMGGAEVAGLSAQVGSITPGKQADLVCIRTDSIHMLPISDAVGAIVLNANASDVDTVMVAGKILKRGGQLVGADWPNLAERLKESRKRIVAGHHGVDLAPIRTMWNQIFPHLA